MPLMIMSKNAFIAKSLPAGNSSSRLKLKNKFIKKIKVSVSNNEISKELETNLEHIEHNIKFIE